MEYFSVPTNKEISERKLEAFHRYSKIIQFGRKYPVRFVERFYGIVLLDNQKYVFQKSWVTPRNVWCQCRGSGKTTLAAPFIMAKSQLFPNHQSYIMAGVGSQSQEAFMKIEKIAKKEIGSFVGLTDFFLGELDTSNSKSDGFLHNPNSFSYKMYNGSRVNSLNGSYDNNRSKRSNLNFYDEAGFAPEDLFVTSLPYITQDANFKMGANIKDISLEPLAVPNQAVFASSASDVTTYFYSVYKEYAKRMFMGDEDYFVADINADIVFNATYNGKVFPSLLRREEVEDMEAKTPEKAKREFYNIFTADGGDEQPFKMSAIKRNSEKRLPEFEGKDGKHYVFAYDPARLLDNSVCLVAEIYDTPDQGYKMRIVNGVRFYDPHKKKKTPLRIPDQLNRIKELILKYNGNACDYDNIEGVLIDAGSGGGGVMIGDDFMEEWVDKSGKSHHGLVDPIIHEDYLRRFPYAIKKLSLLQPTKYKVQMFESAIEMVNQDLISFTDYDNRSSIILWDDSETITYTDDNGKEVEDINRKAIDYQLSPAEIESLTEIELLKEELINIQRYSGGNNTARYDLKLEKKNKMHDDRAYCFAMLGWFLHQKRRSKVIQKKTPKHNITASLPYCASAISF